MRFERLLALSLALALQIAECTAQPGTWTWMKGDNTFGSAGVYGTQGVSAPANKPPGVYECGEWMDLEGNLWIFGGLDLTFGGMYNAMWKYDISTNEWAWMNGSNLPNAAGTYGVMGIADPANTPGARSYGVQTWTDLNGKFWMFGGYGYGYDAFQFGYLSDMWMYDPDINQWTWMNGPDDALQFSGFFGTQGVADPGNFPPGLAESNCTWVRSDNTLWLYGGDASGVTQDNVWMYDPAINQWTWISGTGYTSTTVINYGTLGVESPTNHPGPRNSYAGFEDANGYFYFYGGNEEYAFWRNDVWRYNPANNQWTWIAGSSATDQATSVGPLCESGAGLPGASFELRAAAGNACGFYLFGGQFSDPFLGGGNTNTLWFFDYALNEFKMIKGNGLINASAQYGTQGVSDAGNIPWCRNGGSAWIDLEGNFWTFGGNGNDDNFGFGSINDLWKYQPDPDCIPTDCLVSPVVASFDVDEDTGCAPLTVQFENNSINASEYSWNFDDGGTSTQENPVHTFEEPGTYDVVLIAYGEEDSDTTSLTISVGAGSVAGFSVTTSPCEPFVASFVNQSSNGTNYAWLINGVQVSNEANLNYTFEEGEYEIELVVNNAFNCPDTAASALNLVNCPDVFLYIPNVFSPGSGAQNEVFEILNTGYTDYDLTIFDRWGNKVFTSLSGTKHWNGKVNNSGKECAEGTYYYILNVTDFYGKSGSYDGHLTLLRD